MSHLQNPLINQLKKRLSEDDVWKYFLKVVDELNLEQGVVR